MDVVFCNSVSEVVSRMIRWWSGSGFVDVWWYTDESIVRYSGSFSVSVSWLRAVLCLSWHFLPYFSASSIVFQSVGGVVLCVIS